MWRMRGPGATFPCLRPLRARDLPCSGFDNHSASSVQENANKNKGNRFYFLLFVFPNRDFSKGYKKKKKKIRLVLTRVRGCERERHERMCGSFLPGRRDFEVKRIRISRKYVISISEFVNTMLLDDRG
jgi:hypothetical protein